MRQLTPDGWRNLLYLFVADEETMRPVMMKPFEQGGYVCASDAHVLIRVAKKYITDDYSTPAKAPDVSRIIPAQPPTSKICANELRKAFTILGMDYDTTTIDCIECDNDCEVEWKYTDRDGDEHTKYAECLCCNGTGRVPNGADKYCEIGSNLVRAYFMLLLYRAMMELKVEEVKVSAGCNRPLKFNIGDGIDIVVMPCILDKYSSKKRAPINMTKL
jgi:hypothetical protein